MKKSIKISIFALMVALIMAFSAVAVFAEDKNLNADGTLSFGERAALALQGSVTGILMVFSVLILLTLVVSLSKVIFYDIPKKREAKEKTSKTKEKSVEVVEVEPQSASAPVTFGTPDESEIVAVITAAIAAAIEGSDYKDEFAGGFRVVSFKRTTNARSWKK